MQRNITDRYRNSSVSVVVGSCPQYRLVIARLVMTLDEFLRARKITEDAFAAEVGVTQPAINMIRHGKRLPSLKLMQRIIAATDGLVQPRDFFEIPETASSAA